MNVKLPAPDSCSDVLKAPWEATTVGALQSFRGGAARLSAVALLAMLQPSVVLAGIASPSRALRIQVCRRRRRRRRAVPLPCTWVFVYIRRRTYLVGVADVWCALTSASRCCGCWRRRLS